jgi:hypothetical protein
MQIAKEANQTRTSSKMGYVSYWTVRRSSARGPKDAAESQSAGSGVGQDEVNGVFFDLN